MNNNITFHVVREAHGQHDRICISMINEDFGFQYDVNIDTRTCVVQMKENLPGKRILPSSSPLEKRHGQESLASVLYSMHHWGQHLMREYTNVMAYMRGETSQCINPFDVTSRTEIGDKDQNSFLASTWIGVNPMISSHIKNAGMTFRERMHRYAKYYDLANCSDKLSKGYKIGLAQHRLIRAYCETLKMNPCQLSDWLSRSFE